MKKVTIKTIRHIEDTYWGEYLRYLQGFLRPDQVEHFREHGVLTLDRVNPGEHVETEYHWEQQ